MDKERENLLELFSTRVKDSSPRSTVSLGLEKKLIGPGSDEPTARKSQDGFSPVGNAVLREARRELGSRGDQTAAEDITEEGIAAAVDRVCASRGFVLDDVTRAEVIVALKQDLFGWGVLQPLIDNPEVTDIHCYDFKTVVLQRGKMSEITALRWPSHEAYATFIDRILYRLGKSLSTQQHTIDASFPDGKRICAVHKSVCGSKGPLVTIRVPRVQEASLESLVSYQVAPPLIVNYLAALTRSVEHTFMVSGETGTGKTTLMRSLGTQFRPEESIIAIEDTPELNFQHPYFRSLVSRTANTEGVGEVTLQEHIRTTLRMCPTRVILGEMRTPEAAESFLEAAQTGHCGMSTVHARNARETLTRLESLLGRAQRGVSTDIIRQQIALAVDVVIWQLREKASGRVRMGEVIEVGNFVEGNIQIRPMFKLVQQGESPVWEVLSYSSFFEDVLERSGIYLGDAPKYIGFNQNENSRSSDVIRR
ncbi:MAG TPA: ATPase, T2SS/T4P/T4SS family [Oligoflexia bacterium]|nr:ATPase, T2SS/T4P/T4SS family [Oligoflexia bacterium]HMP47084.1 ATPase, T2SS/T4P/T4SS family [Oligoflexia bacterium]